MKQVNTKSDTYNQMNALSGKWSTLCELLIFGFLRNFEIIIPSEICFLFIVFYGRYNVELILYAIGSNECGQQAIELSTHVKKITKAQTFDKKVKNVISGDRCVYLWFYDGTYTCCGNNTQGQLGIGHYNNVNTFIHTTNNIKIKEIYSTPYSCHSFCISQENKLYATGNNSLYQFGMKTHLNRHNTWIKINTLESIKKISTAKQYTIFLSKNGTIYVAGYHYEGGLGLGETIVQTKTIKQIKTSVTFTDICCGADHTLAIDNNNCIWSWGNAGQGRLGHEDWDNIYSPTIIQYFTRRRIKIKKICCGENHSVVLSVSNKVYSFGNNVFYQCGNGNADHVYSPELNVTLRRKIVVDIKCGYYHNAIKTKGNKYYLWGYNKYNQCLYVSTSSSTVINYIQKPLLFSSNLFYNKKIIDIYLGGNSTRITLIDAQEN